MLPTGGGGVLPPDRREACRPGAPEHPRDAARRSPGRDELRAGSDSGPVALLDRLGSDPERPGQFRPSQALSTTTTDELVNRYAVTIALRHGLPETLEDLAGIGEAGIRGAGPASEHRGRTGSRGTLALLRHASTLVDNLG